MSYSTSISPESPGSIGFSGFLGMVQPHEDEILLKISGAVPTFLNLKTLLPSDSNSTSP